MNYLVFVYFALIVLCWTFNPFIKKVILKKGKMNTDEYFILNHFVITALLIVYFVYLFNNRQCKSECINSLDRYDVFYILLGAITSILGARLLLTIIEYNEVSFMVAHIQPLVISLTFIIGYMFFSENFTIYKLIGISLVVLGIMFLNKKNISS
tara:strand:- start:86 stop:547 length:462 start_codon:yes stop_codon:yes gene_type:complete